MKRAIEQIRQLIQYHENQRNEYIKFFQSPKFIDYTDKGKTEVAIEHAKNIYDELINELKQSIELIEKGSNAPAVKGMKMICECGNEMEFKEKDEETGEVYHSDEERGQYVKTDSSKFDTWAEHDEAGFVCKKCNKAVWFFA